MNKLRLWENSTFSIGANVTKGVHTLYLLFLLFVGVVAIVGPGLYGYNYYSTSLLERPFHRQYDDLKPTGFRSHGYGIVGSAMIIGGVALYSSRKRLRIFSGIGRIKHFLEFHIFLCLVGPILVLYHTTFKIGGLVAVCFWSMIAVVLSGIIGRYLYVQIPKGIQGNELSVAELTEENQRLLDELQVKFSLSPEYVKRIDTIALPRKGAAQMGLIETINFFLMNDLTRRWRLRRVYKALQSRGTGPDVIRRLRRTANGRIKLTRRIAFKQQFRSLFYYWHVIHLPFSIVMFIILFIHVGVAVAFGYTWIW